MGQPGRPKKDPSKRRDGRIEIRVTKTKKQWIKDCAKGKGLSMTRYIETLIDGQSEASDRGEFLSFLHEIKATLKEIRREVEEGSSPAVVLPYVDAAIIQVNNKGRDLFRVAAGPPSDESPSDESPSADGEPADGEDADGEPADGEDE